MRPIRARLVCIRAKITAHPQLKPDRVGGPALTHLHYHRPARPSGRVPTCSTPTTVASHSDTVCVASTRSRGLWALAPSRHVDRRSGPPPPAMHGDDVDQRVCERLAVPRWPTHAASVAGSCLARCPGLTPASSRAPAAAPARRGPPRTVLPLEIGPPSPCDHRPPLPPAFGSGLGNLPAHPKSR